MIRLHYVVLAVKPSSDGFHLEIHYLNYDSRLPLYSTLSQLCSLYSVVPGGSLESGLWSMVESGQLAVKMFPTQANTKRGV
jgi:hypothetical protein